MRQTFHRLMSIPSGVEQDRTQAAFLLYVFSLIMTATALLFLVSNAILYPSSTGVFYDLLAVVLSLAVNCFVRRGFIRSMAGLMTGGFWLLVSLSLYGQHTKGIPYPDFFGYVVPVLIAGSVISGSAGLLVALMSTLFGVALLLLKGVPLFPLTQPLLDWGTASLILCLTAAMMTMVRSRLAGALEQARQSQQALDERNRQLENEIIERRHIEDALKTREESTHKFQEQLKILHEVSIELTRAESLDDLHRQAICLGIARLGFERLGLFLIDEVTGTTKGRFGIDKDGNLADIRYWSQAISEMSSSSMLPEAMSSKQRVSVRRNTELFDVSGKSGDGWNAMAILWNGDKSIGWLAADNLLRGQPLEDYQLEILSLYGSTLGHLSSIKQAELTIRQSEERFFKAFHASPVAIGISDMHPTRRYVDVNESWVRLFGFSRQEIIGLPLDDLQIWDIDSTQSRRYDEQIAKNGSLREISLSARTRQGETLQLLGFAEKIELDGQTNLLSMFQDITRLKLAEKQAVELALERERVALLKDFMSSLSHDLKTPLAVINTSLYLLERLKDPERQQDKLDGIKRQVKHLNNYIHDILTISRLDYSPELSFRDVDVNAVLRSIEEHLRSSVESRSLNLVMELDAGNPLVLGDEVEINRAFTNLMENAVNYTPEFGTIRVRTSQSEGNVVIQVIDTGIGIEPSEREAIFNHFYRTEKARAFHNSGTGLGLAIVKKIAEMHGGSIEVESEYGAGSTFMLRFPAIS